MNEFEETHVGHGVSAVEVVLIHGFGRRPLSMGLLSRRLSEAGFRCTSVGYSSWHTSLDRATDTVLRQIEKQCTGPFHLVGHSFGGLIALRLKQDHPELEIQRVVQMGTPNLGIKTVERLHEVQLVRRIFGPIVDDVAPGAVTSRRKEADVLAIAGTGFPPQIARLYGIQGPSDALVDEVSAYGTAAAQRARVAAVHGWLPLSRKVADLTAHFLASGEVLEKG